MLALYPLWRKARRVYSLTSRLPGTNRLGFQPSLALSDREKPHISQTSTLHQPVEVKSTEKGFLAKFFSLFSRNA
ncbi:MAG: hypothetical protein ABW170_10345 [Candidatus Thiodiazotropha sp. L084R]